jgi:LPXTG-site transpeptidase (sortase) family protein
MATTKEDQNTFIIIGAILIVCVIALIAIASGIWALIREPVNQVFSEIGIYLRSRQVFDYNFLLPTTVTVESSPAQEDNMSTDTQPVNDVDFNFNIPSNWLNANGLTFFSSAILTEEELLEGKVPERLNIIIPKISIDTNLFQGTNSEELLERGFWISPKSSDLGRGEVLIYCNRIYFGPDDTRGCWHIDSLENNDEIRLSLNGFELRYNVVGKQIYSADDLNIENINPQEDLIRIVSTHPIETGEQRIIILAKRVG